MSFCKSQACDDRTLSRRARRRARAIKMKGLNNHIAPKPTWQPQTGQNIPGAETANRHFANHQKRLHIPFETADREKICLMVTAIRIENFKKKHKHWDIYGNCK